ncbi:uncharacterized protein BO88DRAFT_477560 [Aspergillus vadensis CBS 113365]|uniref:Uncharacterized protein n=1 Tax=Aspergillus vadensis (strain CBS 113365 / IMI 142717 / IBT 24658) TaxID=1448311 RepID=A0A319ASS9_ASPVC|nr:hypothetical protein BO88DRAFT_477560 [Aspergillus vadensis CBS 113365]PYH63387.1 hypothetical protein BO88DRAFT_477560 [Aspergillus vadensis CBS 113365]
MLPPTPSWMLLRVNWWPRVTRPLLLVCAACSVWVRSRRVRLRLSIALAYRALLGDFLLSILKYRMTSAWGVAQSTQTCHTEVGIRSARSFPTPVHPYA